MLKVREEPSGKLITRVDLHCDFVDTQDSALEHSPDSMVSSTSVMTSFVSCKTAAVSPPPKFASLNAHTLGMLSTF